jgi:hypothetical protein
MTTAPVLVLDALGDGTASRAHDGVRVFGPDDPPVSSAQADRL